MRNKLLLGLLASIGVVLFTPVAGLADGALCLGYCPEDRRFIPGVQGGLQWNHTITITNTSPNFVKGTFEVDYVLDDGMGIVRFQSEMNLEPGEKYTPPQVLIINVDGIPTRGLVRNVKYLI